VNMALSIDVLITYYHNGTAGLYTLINDNKIMACKNLDRPKA